MPPLFWGGNRTLFRGRLLSPSLMGARRYTWLQMVSKNLICNPPVSHGGGCSLKTPGDPAAVAEWGKPGCRGLPGLQNQRGGLIPAGDKAFGVVISGGHNRIGLVCRSAPLAAVNQVLAD